MTPYPPPTPPADPYPAPTWIPTYFPFPVPTAAETHWSPYVSPTSTLAVIQSDPTNVDLVTFSASNSSMITWFFVILAAATITALIYKVKGER